MDHDFDITFGSILEEDDEFLRRYNKKINIAFHTLRQQ